MPIDVKCKGCGAEFTTSDEFAGQKANCPDCGHQIMIPGQPGLELEPASAAVATRPSAAVATKPAERPAAPPREPEPPPKPSRKTEAESADPARLARARMVEYFRIALVIAISLAAVKVFEAGVAVLYQHRRITPRSFADGVAFWSKHVAEASKYAPALTPLAERAATLGQMPALPVLVLVGVMVLLAFRLLARAKMLDALYVASAHWAERTLAGVTFYFLSTLGLVALLAWTASLLKNPGTSDTVACGLIAVWLLASSLTAWVAHLTSGREFPHVTGHMFNDLLFGAAILAVFTFGQHIPSPLSRVSTVSVLVMLNFAIEMTMSSVFLLESPAVGRLFRRVGFLLVSLVLIGAAGWLLALAGA